MKNSIWVLKNSSLQRELRYREVRYREIKMYENTKKSVTFTNFIRYREDFVIEKFVIEKFDCIMCANAVCYLHVLTLTVIIPFFVFTIHICSLEHKNAVSLCLLS